MALEAAKAASVSVMPATCLRQMTMAKRPMRPEGSGSRTGQRSTRVLPFLRICIRSHPIPVKSLPVQRKRPSSPKASAVQESMSVSPLPDRPRKPALRSPQDKKQSRPEINFRSFLWANEKPVKLAFVFVFNQDAFWQRY